MEHLFEAMIPAIAIVFTFGIPGILIYYVISIRHKEKMKLIDMGMTPEEARSFFKEMNTKPKQFFSSLKWGILFTAVGLGLFFGILLEAAGYEDSLTGVMVLLFVGFGFLIYYGIMSKKSKKEQITS